MLGVPQDRSFFNKHAGDSVDFVILRLQCPYSSLLQPAEDVVTGARVADGLRSVRRDLSRNTYSDGLLVDQNSVGHGARRPR